MTKTFVEIGIGASREQGYGTYFPFEAGDQYIGVDLPEATGCQGMDMEGKPIVNEVIIGMDKLDELAAGDEFIGRIARPNAQRLAAYAEARGTSFHPIYADGRRLPLADESVDGVLLSNVVGDPRLRASEKTKLLQEALRVVKLGQLVVVRETVSSKTAEIYFDEHDWPVELVDDSSPRWPLLQGQYDLYIRGIIFELPKIAMD